MEDIMGSLGDMQHLNSVSSCYPLNSYGFERELRKMVKQHTSCKIVPLLLRCVIKWT